MSNHVLTGVIHIHTTDSDGTKTHQEVIDLAREVGLEFLMFSDHMTLKGKKEGKEGFYEGVPVIIGYEHNDEADCNHYLIFNTDETLPAEMSAEEYVAAAAQMAGIGIMAHPDEIRGLDARWRSYPWTAWSVRDFNGVELWNQMSEWMEHLNMFNQLLMVLSPRKWLKAPTDRILRQWDEMNEKRKVVGIGSADAHGFIYKKGPVKLTIFPYKVQFKSLRSHVILNEPLSSDFETAKKQIYDAILDCRLFISNYRWGEARDFRFEIESRGATAKIGGTVKLDVTALARVACPLRGRIRLIGNGIEVVSTTGTELEHKLTKPGIFRVEVWRGKRGWIFSNHIRLE